MGSFPLVFKKVHNCILSFSRLYNYAPINTHTCMCEYIENFWKDTEETGNWVQVSLGRRLRTGV